MSKHDILHHGERWPLSWLPLPHAISENILYAVVWLMVFAGPALNLYTHMLDMGKSQYPWDMLADSWQYSALFFLTFLVHNWVLAPMLIRKRRRGLYLLCAAVLLLAFLMAQHWAYPFYVGIAQADGPVDGLPAVITDQMNVVNLVLAVLMMGGNMGVKIYYTNEASAVEREQWEKQMLMQQRDYLRYQVNPHFFMNTLNSIHALVDINPAQAKSTIRELSSLMRYILYEGSHPSVPLQHEIQFMHHYTTLMRVRYAGLVNISTDVPQCVPERNIPPLMFIIFVENAFKHGISYQADSYIRIRLRLRDEGLSFTCVNSSHPRPVKERGGLGLRNVQRRLELIYGQRFTLDIDNGPKEFKVRLEMPYMAPSPVPDNTQRGGGDNIS